MKSTGRGLMALTNRALAQLGMQLVSQGRLKRMQAQHVETLSAFDAYLRAGSLAHVPANDRRPQLLAGLVGTSLDVAFTLLDNLHHTLSLPGDLFKYGVAQGATSALLANEIATTDKRLWLFDSFEGLPPPTEQDELLHDIFGYGSMAAYAGAMKVPVEAVQSRLGALGFPTARTEIVPGFIETTLQGQRIPQQVCFAYVDLDLYEPIKTALAFLAPRLTAGGAIVVHDYDHFSSGVKTAVDAFVAAQDGRFSMQQRFGVAVLRSN